jgi:hypothetical protein
MHPEIARHWPEDAHTCTANHYLVPLVEFKAHTLDDNSCLNALIHTCAYSALTEVIDLAKLRHEHPHVVCEVENVRH